MSTQPTSAAIDLRKKPVALVHVSADGIPTFEFSDGSREIVRDKNTAQIYRSIMAVDIRA